MLVQTERREREAEKPFYARETGRVAEIKCGEKIRGGHEVKLAAAPSFSAYTIRTPLLHSA